MSDFWKLIYTTSFFYYCFSFYQTVERSISVWSTSVDIAHQFLIFRQEDGSTGRTSFSPLLVPKPSGRWRSGATVQRLRGELGKGRNLTQSIPPRFHKFRPRDWSLTQWRTWKTRGGGRKTPARMDDRGIRTAKIRRCIPDAGRSSALGCHFATSIEGWFRKKNSLISKLWSASMTVSATWPGINVKGNSFRRCVDRPTAEWGYVTSVKVWRNWPTNVHWNGAISVSVVMETVAPVPALDHDVAVSSDSNKNSSINKDENKDNPRWHLSQQVTATRKLARSLTKKSIRWWGGRGPPVHVHDACFCVPSSLHASCLSLHIH